MEIGADWKDCAAVSASLVAAQIDQTPRAFPTEDQLLYPLISILPERIKK